MSSLRSRRTANRVVGPNRLFKSPADKILGRERQGLVFDFTTMSLVVKDDTTEANRRSPLSTSVFQTDDPLTALLTYTSPSVKMTMGPAGTLRYPAHNLALQSETASSWTVSGVSRSGNTFSGFAGGFQFVQMSVPSGAAGTPYVVTVWMSGNGTITLDSNGVGAIQTGIALTGTITAYTYTTTNVGNNVRVISYGGNTATSVTIEKIHVRRTPSDSTYLATTTAARYALPLEWSSAGVLQGMLVEEARTNLCVYSQDLTDAAWTKVSTSVVANSVIAPDGTLTADTLTITAATASHYVGVDVAFTAAAYSCTFYAKAGTTDKIQFCCGFSARTGDYANFDLANGALGTVSANFTASITSVGNGWYRCLVNVTPTGAGTAGFFVAGITSLTDGRVPSYLGTGETVYIWGAQFELGAFPTSYIQTYASSVTRAADNVNFLTSISPTTAFPLTMMAEIYYLNNGYNFPCPMWIGDIANPTTQRCQIYNGESGANYSSVLRIASTAGSINKALTGNITPRTVSRVGLVAQSGSSNGSVNGSISTDDTTAVNTTCNTVYFNQANTQFMNGYLRKFVLLPRRMSNAELQTLTTP